MFFRKIAGSTAHSPEWFELATRASNTFTGNQSFIGKVGIGTTNPDYNLTVYDETTSVIQVKNASRSSNLQQNTSGGALNLYNNAGASNVLIRSYGVSYFNGGNIGIGTTSPSEKLEIYNSSTTPGVLSLKSVRNDAGYVDVGRISAKQRTTEVARIGMPRAGGTYTGYLTFWTKSTNSGSLVTEKVRIDPNGGVGIGTEAPDYPLDVAGTIRAQEVIVEIAAPAPDYVFEEDYNLRTLSEVESFVKENKHLPDVPAGESMEQNGIGVAEMNMLLLQKVEELTLYTIQQQEIIEKQSKISTSQQEIIDDLLKRIEKLEIK